MNMNVFWGIYVLVFGIGTLIVWYFFSPKKKQMKKKCTMKITGKIISYSNVLYGGISLPVVSYAVNNVVYKVVGPKFKSYVVKTISNPFNKVESSIESNLTTREELPQTLKMTIRRNGLVSFTKSPLQDLYPVGSDVDVYYNPSNPKMSYVQRYVKPLRFVDAFLFIGIILVALSLFFFFGPTLKPMYN